jgi:hypothetical protein
MGTAITDGTIVTINYTNPGVAIGIQTTGGSLAVNIVDYKTGPGLQLVPFPIQSGDVVQEGNYYTGKSYKIQSNLVMAADGTVEASWSGQYGPQFALEGVAIIFVEVDGGGIFKYAAFGGSAGGSTGVLAYPTDRIRLKRVGSTIDFQIKRDGASNWINIDTRTFTGTVPLLITVLAQGVLNKIQSISDIFGSGLS